MHNTLKSLMYDLFKLKKIERISEEYAQTKKFIFSTNLGLSICTFCRIEMNNEWEY